jgi:cytoskeletal protein CcmA (bactofilin family)
MQPNRNIPELVAGVIVLTSQDFFFHRSAAAATRRLPIPNTMSTQQQPTLVNASSRSSKDNWLGFVGDVVNFTGEVCFKSMLRIDGNFSGHVTSQNGTLIVSTGASVTKAVIKVAVAKINGTVEGDILASKELVLGRTANVKGQVASPALVVEEGAQLNGHCRRIAE